MTVEIRREAIDAVLFDMDGVVTDTASVHAAAWREVFDDALRVWAARAGEPFEPFRDEDYLAFVDGKPREEGIVSFLASRGIGSGPDDDPVSVRGIGERKNRRFLELVRANGVDVFRSTVDLLDELRSAGIRTGLFTASRNMEEVLEAAGVSGRFDERVGGVEAARWGLSGKPAPDVLVRAATMLGIEPDRVAVFEDSRAGVEAARRGGFHLVIGIDREGTGGALLDAGADAVIGDAAEARLTPPPSVADLPSAAASWSEVIDRIAGRDPVVFLDYDGTLTPIVNRPEEALLPVDARRAIVALAAVHPLAIVSGRDLDDVRSMVGIDGIAIAGSHGFDIQGPDGARYEVGADHAAALDEATRAVEPLIARIPGARIERKRFATAVHFREAGPGAMGDVEAAVDSVVASHPGLRRTGGKMIVELRPDIDWDKGRAIARIQASLGLDGPDVAPVYVGDDETDEDAFREVRARGIGVIVRGEGDDRPTLARFSLSGPGDVPAFLELLAHVPRGRRG